MSLKYKLNTLPEATTELQSIKTYLHRSFWREKKRRKLHCILCLRLKSWFPTTRNNLIIVMKCLICYRESPQYHTFCIKDFLSLTFRIHHPSLIHCVIRSYDSTSNLPHKGQKPTLLKLKLHGEGSYSK